MAEKKKYYWLKLKNDFFKRHDIRIVESMPNGKDYVLFYLKLLVESVSHDGNLRFSETIPYSADMLSTITNTNIDIVKSAINIFTELNLMDILDDNTIYMQEVEKMTGAETEWAEKKRLYRQKQLKIETEIGQKKTMSDKSKSLEKEKEKEKELDNIFVHYEKNISTISPIVAQKLITWQKDLSDELIKEAMNKASMANARNFNYINAILIDWSGKGYKSLADIKGTDQHKSPNGVDDSGLEDSF